MHPTCDYVFEPNVKEKKIEKVIARRVAKLGNLSVSASDISFAMIRKEDETLVPCGSISFGRLSYEDNSGKVFTVEVPETSVEMTIPKIPNKYHQ